METLTKINTHESNPKGLRFKEAIAIKERTSRINSQLECENFTPLTFWWISTFIFYLLNISHPPSSIFDRILLTVYATPVVDRLKFYIFDLYNYISEQRQFGTETVSFLLIFI